MDLSFQDNDSCDVILPFLFDDLPIKGKLIVLKNSWAKMIANFNYDEISELILSQMTLSAIYFGSSLKFDGSISAQLQDFGNISLAMVECTQDLKIRGFLKNKKSTPTITDISHIDITQGKLALNVKTKKDNTNYQSVIPVVSSSIEEIFRSYLLHSEQVKSELVYFSNPDHVIALFIQQLPLSEAENHDDVDVIWNEIVKILKNVPSHPIYESTPEDFLQNLFPKIDIRVFKKSSVSMECSCSREKVEQMIILLGKDDSKKIIKEQGKISITCEMCKNIQTFNDKEIENLF